MDENPYKPPAIEKPENQGADGSDPLSIPSGDYYMSDIDEKGLPPEALCPKCGKPLKLKTVGASTRQPPGRMPGVEEDYVIDKCCGLMFAISDDALNRRIISALKRNYGL